MLWTTYPTIPDQAAWGWWELQPNNIWRVPRWLCRGPISHWLGGCLMQTSLSSAPTSSPAVQYTKSFPLAFICSGGWWKHPSSLPRPEAEVNSSSPFKWHFWGWKSTAASGCFPPPGSTRDFLVLCLAGLFLALLPRSTDDQGPTTLLRFSSYEPGVKGLLSEDNTPWATLVNIGWGSQVVFLAPENIRFQGPGLCWGIGAHLTAGQQTLRTATVVLGGRRDMDQLSEQTSFT